jgi:hypothetical protein
MKICQNCFQKFDQDAVPENDPTTKKEVFINSINGLPIAFHKIDSHQLNPGLQMKGF